METIQYKIRFYVNSEYEVLNGKTLQVLFNGTLANCYAWIKLKEGDYFIEAFKL